MKRAFRALSSTPEVPTPPSEIPFHPVFAGRIPHNATAGHDRPTKADVAAIAPVAGGIAAGSLRYALPWLMRRLMRR